MYTEGFWHIFVTNFEWELRSKYDWKCSKTDRIHTTMCLVLRDVIRVFSERGLSWKNAEFREHFISYFTNFFTKFRIFSRNWILRKGRKDAKFLAKKWQLRTQQNAKFLAKNTKFSRNDFPISLETLLIMKLKMQVRKIYEPRFNITLQSSQRTLVIICSRLYTGLPTNNETVKTT